MRSRPTIALAILFATAACGACSADDNGMSADAAADAPDQPTELKFETQATDLVTQLALFDVTVSEVGASNTTQSAPNGRAVLTIANAAGQVSHSLAGFLGNTMAVDPEALLTHNDANEPLISHLVSVADLDTLYSGIGVVRDDQATQLILYVRASDFTPATGVNVTVDGGGQSYVRGGGGFEAGSAPLTDALVLVPNVVGTQASVTLSATCPGPSTVALAAGEIASAFYVCDPSL